MIDDGRILYKQDETLYNNDAQIILLEYIQIFYVF